MQVKVIINAVQKILNDEYVTYEKQELLDWINDAQKFVCLYKHDACSSINSVPVTAGSKQTIPATARRLGDVVSNKGDDGLKQGSAVRINDDMNDLDSYLPSWHDETDDEVECYFYDERYPRIFYIYPQPQLPHYLELKTIDNPVDVTSEIDDINILDIYAPALVSWAVYRALSKDSEKSPNVQRAQEHKSTAFEILGVKLQSDSAASPNNK